MKCTVCCKPLPDNILAQVLVGAISPRAMTCSKKCSEARAAEARLRAGQCATRSPSESAPSYGQTPKKEVKLIKRRPVRKAKPQMLSTSSSSTSSYCVPSSASLKSSAMSAKLKLEALRENKQVLRKTGTKLQEDNKADEEEQRQRQKGVAKEKKTPPPPRRPKQTGKQFGARRPAPPPPRPTRQQVNRKKTGADAGAGNGTGSQVVLEEAKKILDPTCIKELEVEELRSVELWAKDHQEKLEEMRSAVNRAIEDAVTGCGGNGTVDADALEKVLKGTVTRGITEIERRVLRHLANEQISGKTRKKKRVSEKKIMTTMKTTVAAASAAVFLLLVFVIFMTQRSSVGSPVLSGPPIPSTIDAFNAVVDTELAGADAALRKHFANTESFPLAAQNLRDISEDRLGYLAKATVGVVGMALTGGLAAPYVGSIVGVHALGLAGSAATQGGLAALGGGAISAGGFGVAGGTVAVAGSTGLSTAGVFTLFRQMQQQPAARDKVGALADAGNAATDTSTVGEEVETGGDEVSASFVERCLSVLQQSSRDAHSKLGLAETPALDIFGTINYIIDGNSLYSDTLLYDGDSMQPLYFGEFKRRAPHGRGCIFRPPTDPAACRIAFAGEFDAGERQGRGTVFSPDKGCKPIYVGAFEDNLVAITHDANEEKPTEV